MCVCVCSYWHDYVFKLTSVQKLVNDVFHCVKVKMSSGVSFTSGSITRPSNSRPGAKFPQF